MKHVIIIDTKHELVPFTPNHAAALLDNPSNQNAFELIKLPDNHEFHLMPDGKHWSCEVE